MSRPRPSRRLIRPDSYESRRQSSGSTDGFQEFDSCGNRLALRVGARPAPPHPNPLPKEREPRRPCSQTLGVLRSTARRDRLLPLPKGEGWGEGEADARTTHIVRLVSANSRSSQPARKRLHLPRGMSALLNTATGSFSLSPPAERGERAGERGRNAKAHKDRGGFRHDGLLSPALSSKGGEGDRIVG